MKFTISIVAFDGIEHVRRCVQSVLDAGSAKNEAELILIDNGSTDGTGDYFDSVARTHAHVRVAHFAKNLGFQIPHKWALSQAKGDLFVLLNSDCEVPAGWLARLAAPLDADYSVAASGPQHGHCELHPNFHGKGGDKLEYLEGACLCVRTSVVREHGLFAPYLYFAYGEDSDLSLRLRQLGYQLSAVHLAVKHIGQATSSRVPGVMQAQEANHAALRQRWRHYLRTRRFDAPIILRRVGGAYGDVLLMTPIIAALRRERPLSHIYVDAAPCNGVLHRNPHVAGFLPDVQTTHDDETINLVGAYERRPGMHIIDAYALEAGISKYDRRTEFFGFHPVSGFATEREPHRVAIHLGPSHWPGKDWPAARWHAVIESLWSGGWDVVLVGNQTGAPIPGVFRDLRGNTPLIGELATVLRSCVLFIGLDSFPMHLAQAVGTPVIGLFGTTQSRFILTDGSPAVGIDADESAAPCAGDLFKKTRSQWTPCDGACMRTITVERVLAAVVSFRSSGAAPLKANDGARAGAKIRGLGIST